MYKIPELYQKLVAELKQDEEIGSYAETFAHVGLGLFLAEYLGLDDEPVTVVWALLSGTPISYPSLAALNTEQRRAIANARLIVPHSARSSWLAALSTYIREIPQQKRDFNFVETDLDKLDHWLIAPAIRPDKERNAHHFHVYHTCLTTKLDFDSQQRSYAMDGRWSFRAEIQEEDDVRQSTVELNEEYAALAPVGVSQWLKVARPRAPFQLDVQQLHSIAQDLDRRDAELNCRFTSQGAAPPLSVPQDNWETRWSKIELHPVNGNTLAPEKGSLTINGWAHIAGMVASGKSTLATLIAAAVVKSNRKQRETEQDISLLQRVTLVVPDVDTALRLANQLNWWFLDSPETQAPVAVPLLGRTSRSWHQQILYNSAAYREAMQKGKPHWAERWISTVCPLQGVLSKTEQERLGHHKLKPGTEPCTRLFKETAKSPTPHLCPFFSRCPSQQAYFDMPTASIWITTPGAMAGATLPGQLDDRRQVRLGDLIYEQSDLVLVDEADTVMEWFDGVYAEEVALTNGRDGVLNELDTEVTSHRNLASYHDKWMDAVHDSSANAAKILMQARPRKGRYQTLEKWSQGASFTPYTLFYHLAQCLVVGRKAPGYEEFLSEAARQARQDHTRIIMAWFDEFLRQDPVLKVPLPGYPQRKGNTCEITQDLHALCRAISENGDSTTDLSIHIACKRWVERAYCEGQRKFAPEEPIHELSEEVADALGYLLQFAFNVRLLDHHTHTVFVEWHRKPAVIQAEQPHRRIPRGLIDILPLPPEGRQFGAFLTKQPKDAEEGSDGRRKATSRPPSLSMFAYTNIGREYLLGFHRLRTALDGKPGPNVIALSGTSYLPDSTRFHIGHPQAALQSEKECRDSIAQSEFAFVPRHIGQKPIRVSGVDDKENALQYLVRALCNVQGEGNIVQEYERLKANALDPKWQDRARILMFVNSYEQAEAAQIALNEVLRGHPELKESIRALKRLGDGSEAYEDKHRVVRADVENFACTDGKILIAPLSAVGRGVNILNSVDKAAFGAVYFLVRPMPHPVDAKAIAQEVNRRTLDWAQDPDFRAWQKDGIEQCARELRKCANELWRSAERRTYYRSLTPDEQLGFDPRHDLAATTAGLMIQAVGRLVRGGVPFHAYFADAAWAPQSALASPQPDTEKTSLLVALRERLCAYAAKDDIGRALYGPLIEPLMNFKGLLHKDDSGLSQ